MRAEMNSRESNVFTSDTPISHALGSKQGDRTHLGALVTDARSTYFRN